MRSPRTLFHFVTFQTLHCPLRFSACGRRTFNFAEIVSPVLLTAIAIIFSYTARGDVPITAYLSPEPVGPCPLACQCDGNFDSVVWDQLEVRVGRGSAPGLYAARYHYYNGSGLLGWTGNINVSMAADGTFTAGPEFDWPALYGGYARYPGQGWEVNGGPSPFSVDGDLIVINSTVCGGNAQLLHGRVNIQIGTPSSEHQKPNDIKLGGDQCTLSAPMARYSAHAMSASLNIEDTPFGYAPPRGPRIDFIIIYNQRDPAPFHGFSCSNLGPRWGCNWFSYINDDPTDPSAKATVFVPGGGTEVYSGFSSGTQTYSPDLQSQAVLVRISPSSYEKHLPDGSKLVYSQSDGATTYPRRIFMTQVVDPAGNAVTISFDPSFRITAITDALGQVTTLSYELPDDPLKITKVTEPFPTGRSAKFTYANKQLAIITDEIGIQSQLHYAPGTDFIDSITTPYGTSHFATGTAGSNKWIEMTDPLGGKERVEYRDRAPGISASDPPASVPAGFANSGLDVANTFYWNKKTIETFPPISGGYDYTKAEVIHWLKDPEGLLVGIIASEKPPLENRVWYAYAGQSDTNHIGAIGQPAKIARIFGDGTTQSSLYEYSNLGLVTRTTDPVGRVLTYIYDTNGIDLLEVRQTTGTANELLRKVTYNSQHEPLIDTDTAGQAATFTYNSYGQILTRKNARKETTTFTYGDGTSAHPIGYLTSISGPPFNGASATTIFAYDSANRVRLVTDSDSYTTVTDYDNLDRPTQITFPDGTTQQFQYTQDFGQGVVTILDLTTSKDRRGLWTTRHYNGSRQMDSITDPLSRTTRFGWCSCGSLTSITDPNNQVTTFNRDLQGRVYQKVFADNTTINYLYDGQTSANGVGASSRLKLSTDAKNQRTNYSYFVDDNIQQISYTNTSGQSLNPPTPSVSFTYDSIYNRVKTMVDGTGATVYAYNPITSSPALGAGQLASIDGPIGNDIITFNYDEFGRVTSRSINGTANTSSWFFDSLGRISSVVNKLGTFVNAYVGITDRLSKVTYPGGVTENYSYFPNAQDKRLQEIKNLTPKNALISQFDYTYDQEGQILTWAQNYSGLNPAPQRFDLSYDNADQLIAAPLKNASTNGLINQYAYGYDAAGNRTSEQAGSVTTTSVPNIVNELASQSGGTNRTLTYDANGNLINDGSKRTFEWDAANRLTAINYTGTKNRTEFSYDGLNRMSKIVEKAGTKVQSTKKFVWCGMERCESRNDKDAVALRFYPQGQHNGTTPYYYTRDHLGSIREMFKSDGTVGGRYDYDPYGRSTTVKTAVSDFNFTGLYRHSASNLDFAVYRAYDPDLGRWLSRDPIGENGGINLYDYAANGPTSAIDPLGQDVIVLFASKKVWGQGHIATLIGNNDSGWYYYSRNGYDKWPWEFGGGDFSTGYFHNFEEFKEKGYADEYRQAYQIKTGKDRDDAMIEYANEHYNERYHSILPPSNNCADLTEEILAYGGIPILGNNQYPLRYFPGISSFGYIGSPEVPMFLFENIKRTGAGYLWQAPP
jgi:RHS repeat-associated protein